MATTTSLLNGVTFNEIHPSPANGVAGNLDHNGDGTISSDDEYIELFNTTGSSVNLNGFELWDNGTLVHTFGATDSVAANGKFTLVDGNNPVGAGPVNVAGTAVFSSGSLSIATGDALGLYDPGSNKFIVVYGSSSSGPGNATNVINGIQAAHAGATQAGSTEQYAFAGDGSGVAGQRYPDGSDTWVNDPPTPGATNVCFAPGSLIATDTGETRVEDLSIGDMVRTAQGTLVPVKWIGRQTSYKARQGANAQPIRICTGALGDGLPHSDLTVTADHGMVIDELVINASALVNGTTINWVPMQQIASEVIYYHIETEAHDVIIANGTTSETYVDVPNRMMFDNYDEYLALYGEEHRVIEMFNTRITSQRLLPNAIKSRLGITDQIEQSFAATA